MGIYAITGGSSGIGACTKDLLTQQGNRVVNIDLAGGDVTADLATPEGRAHALSALSDMCPEGLDGIVCNAGVSATCGDPRLIVSLNYFGAVDVAEGVFDLLRKRHGSCVAVSSNTIAHGGVRMDIANLLNNQADEARILGLVKDAAASEAHGFYTATKYALTRWARRVSADWAARGVRVNVVAPGNVRTAMTNALSDAHMAAVKALPVPINYQSGDPLMDPLDIANAIGFLLSPAAHGINGTVLFADGGTDALLNSERI